MSHAKDRVCLLVNGYIGNNAGVYIPESILDIIITFHGFYDTSFNSDILIDKKVELMELICNKLNNKYIKLSRIYSGKNDGFEAKTFHKLCDDQGPTLSVILNEFGYIFGGYAKVSWKGTYEYTYITDPDAFLFNLFPTNKIYLPKGRYKKTIRHQKTHLIQFGGGASLKIHNKCNVNRKSNSCPFSYDIPNINEFVGGNPDGRPLTSINFMVKNMEVFKVIYNQSIKGESNQKMERNILYYINNI